MHTQSNLTNARIIRTARSLVEAHCADPLVASTEITAADEKQFDDATIADELRDARAPHDAQAVAACRAEMRRMFVGIDRKDSEVDAVTATAHAYLAGGYSIRGYVYHDAASGSYRRVAVADLADLGRRLERGDEDAMSRWSAETRTVDVDEVPAASKAIDAAHDVLFGLLDELEYRYGDDDSPELVFPIGLHGADEALEHACGVLLATDWGKVGRPGWPGLTCDAPRVDGQAVVWRWPGELAYLGRAVLERDISDEGLWYVVITVQPVEVGQ